MRGTWLALAFAAGLAVAGCGSDDAMHGAVPDMAVPDLARATGDMTPPVACNPKDPMTDGTACPSTGPCPSGQTAVNFGGSCKCFQTCTTNPECSCNRLCDPLTLNDASAGAACLPGNSPGERCGRNPNGTPAFGVPFCGQLTACVNADQAQMFRYCSYRCTSQTDCPAQTTCKPYFTNGQPDGLVCAYNSGPNGNKNLGDACTAADVCKTGLLCAGTCLPQCDGPGATCASGTCTLVTDGGDMASGKIIGYVCK